MECVRPEACHRQRRLKYDVTEAHYTAMLAAQGGCCAICKSPDPRGKGAFHVDHDHGTGVVRGLLCTECNLGLGKFQDNIAFLQAAQVYLLQH